MIKSLFSTLQNGELFLEYSRIADAYEKIESTRKRLEMTNHLVELIQKTPVDILGKMVYLTQGKLYPDYMGIEIGMAERMIITCLTLVSNLTKGEINRRWNQIGDLGSTAEKVLSEHRSIKKHARKEALTVEQVYNTFDTIAKTSGKGSVEVKVNLLADLLSSSTEKEARYIVRTVTGKLRLGIGDMTVLDALAITFGGGKAYRRKVERAYNMSSDLGLVSETLAKKGVKGISRFRVRLGRPIRPMLCERLTTADEILEKLNGKGSVEYKYDGLRIQAHISAENNYLFSRRLENITTQFPDVITALGESVIVKEAILEGECIAVDLNTGELRPFQVIAQRRGRKYGIKRMIEAIPVVLIIFDALHVDGKSLIDVPYIERRKILEEVVRETEKVKITHPTFTENPIELDELMDEAVENGCEGVVVKSVEADSIYQAGARGFLWIKYKREYKSEMADTVDLVAVGAFAGRGRRAGTYGALLMASYDEKTDTFTTVCKLGTGFNDKTLSRLPKLFQTIDHIHPRVVSKIKADYWFVPEKVLEVLGSELTLSPSHTSGLDVFKDGAGLAIRFPRFTGRWRSDKTPEDATRVQEIVNMYRSQLKHV